MAKGALLAVLAGCAFLASCAGTRALVPLLRRAAVLDRPNERSSHDAPVPRGGGIAIAGTIAASWIALCGLGEIAPASLVIVGGLGILAAVSWIDDLRGLPPGLRLLFQFATVAAGIWALPRGAVFQGWLPPWLDAAATVLVWMWFVNLFNFMDGIDGIAGSEAAAVGLGLTLLASLGVAADPAVAASAVAVAGAALGFLVWNWAPARIFMGDVGSVPLGYVLGYLLLELARRGWWKAALILPAYFLADATLTLLRRIARRERVWQAHREHFYQQAVQRGLGHGAVVLRVIAADVMLVAAAWAAENFSGFEGLALAATIVLLLLVELGRRRD
jgi:UDP-N-acetylmuramyl pentapeptide phosphotransferase/UDP-N-acetylglucosamine-1-phosphate transferase